MTGSTPAPQPDARAPQVPAGRLFLAFARLGATAFGGPAMVAYIRDLAVVRKQWLSAETFGDGVALCQSIPGATAMQTAAYVGLRAGGPWGAAAAFVGFGLPAFVLMLILSAAYQATRDLGPIVSAFRGLNVVVVALVANAAINFGRTSIRNWRDALLAAGAAAFLAFRGSPVWVVIAAAGFGAILFRGVPLPEAKPHSAARGGTHNSWVLPALLLLFVAGGMAALFVLDRKLFGLVAVMLKIDVFAFGGGFASVPLMLHEAVDVRGWLDSKTFMDGIALGQVTPGPIVITATFVGYQVAGLAGAVGGTLGIFTPSLFMVLATVPYFDRLQGSVLFRRATRGVLASFVGLLVAAAISFGGAISWRFSTVLLCAVALAALRLKVSILWVVLVGAGLSVILL